MKYIVFFFLIITAKALDAQNVVKYVTNRKPEVKYLLRADGVQQDIVIYFADKNEYYKCGDKVSPKFKVATNETILPKKADCVDDTGKPIIIVLGYTKIITRGEAESLMHYYDPTQIKINDTVIYFGNDEEEIIAKHSDPILTYADNYIRNNHLNDQNYVNNGVQRTPFRAFYGASGSTHTRGPSISHIALAGGGVVLKGVAKPKHIDSLSLFTGITFSEGKNGISTMSIQTKESSMYYSDVSWLMRDAAMLVKSENVYEVFREVSLFGVPTEIERHQMLKANQLPEDYYAVEMADSLRRTKSGQTLLYVDIMLAGRENTKYYSNNNLAYNKYQASIDSLTNIISTYNDSIYKIYDKLDRKLIAIDSLKKSGKLDSAKVEKYSKEITDSLSKLTLKSGWNDYTYNDEKTNYTFYYTKNDKRLHIDGEPNYTFLIHHSNLFSDSVEVDSAFTDYYARNRSLIKNLNYVVVTYAEDFGKIAAFYRYLKRNYPKLWNQVCTHYVHTKKTKGLTPRFIKIAASD